MPEGAIARGRNDSFAYTPTMADKKISKKKDRAPEDRIVAFYTNRPGIDVEMYALRWGGESRNRQFKSARPCTRTTRQGPRVLGFVASLVVYNVWVVINALLYQENMMRIRNSPPLIELDSVLAILVDTMAGSAQGPGRPGPRPPRPDGITPAPAAHGTPPPWWDHPGPRPPRPDGITPAPAAHGTPPPWWDHPGPRPPRPDGITPAARRRRRALRQAGVFRPHAGRFALVGSSGSRRPGRRQQRPAKHSSFFVGALPCRRTSLVG